MRLADIEWGVIRGALGALVLAAAIGATLYTAATRFRDAMQVKYSESHQRLQSVTGKYLAVDQEEMIIREQYPRFVELVRKGVIGNEQRLNWIEVLKRTAAITKLPSLRYEICRARAVHAGFRAGHRALSGAGEQDEARSGPLARERSERRARGLGRQGRWDLQHPGLHLPALDRTCRAEAGPGELEERVRPPMVHDPVGER